MSKTGGDCESHWFNVFAFNSDIMFIDFKYAFFHIEKWNFNILMPGASRSCGWLYKYLL